MAVEQYVLIERSGNLLIPCIQEAPLWKYILYKERQDVFGDVTFDPSVPSRPFTLNGVIIDGARYYRRNSLSIVQSYPKSWIQEGGVLYIHYDGSLPAWLFSYHVKGFGTGRSTGKTRFFDGMKYSAGLDAGFKYQIEADNLEYAKLKLVGESCSIPAQGEFDTLTDILGNSMETSYSLDGENKIPLGRFFIEEAEITLDKVSVRGADIRERLDVSVAAEVFTAEEYPKMKETLYGKNKQEVFGFCRGVPAVCVDQRDIYINESESLYKTTRTFRVASKITRIDKIEVKMTQPQAGQNSKGDVWVDQTGSQSTSDYANGKFTLPASKCMPLVGSEPDYGNEPYDVRVTGLFKSSGSHYQILSRLFQDALGDLWYEECNETEMVQELAGTGTVGLFIEKETKIFDVIQTLQSSGIYGWQLHDWRGKLTIRKDDNNRPPLTEKKIRGIDIININEVSISIALDNYATVVEAEYRRNYSEKSDSGGEARNILRDDSNRAYLRSIFRGDKTYTAKSYLDSAGDAALLVNYLAGHFAIPRVFVRGIRLFGSEWLDLRIYDIIGVYLEQELKQDRIPLMLMVLQNEIRRQEAAVFGAAQRVYYIRGTRQAERRVFGGNIFIKITNITHDISTLITTIDGLYMRNI
jgi:hypothetical protein